MPGRRTGRAGAGLVGLVAAVTVSGCGGSGSETTGSAAGAAASTADEVRTVDHALGEAEISGTPERVVVLDTGELDTVLSLGVTPVGAVRTDASTELPGYLADAGADPDEIAEVGTIAEPNLEAIAALDPDLILSNTARHTDLYDQLQGIAPTVMGEGVGETWKQNLPVYAEALGRPEEGEELLTEYEDRAAEVGALFGEPAEVEVSIVRSVGTGSARLYGEGSFIGTVLADAGFARPELQRTDETFVEVGPEEIGRADGDLLFYSAYGEGGEAELADLTNGGLWQSMGAVQRGDAVPVDDDRWFLAIGPLGAGLVLDDLTEVAQQRS
ncbi:ABC transporter substrate-binding protein [Modestobacter roseus]|nr:ABC transporter substrate-binding protein [Modestobacter roseus]